MKTLIAHRREVLESSALALVGGVLWALCHGTETSWLLPWFSLVPLIVIAGRPRAFFWGWAHGTVHWLIAMWWIIPTLVTFGGLPPALSQVLFVLLAIYLGLDQALFAWLGGKIWRRGGAWTWLGIPALWVVSEVLRGWPFGGFPWNLAAYAWVDMPGALPLSAWIGAFGVSWIMLLANVGLARALVARRWDLAILAVFLPLTLLITGGRFASQAVLEPANLAGSADVRIVQPDSPIVGVEEALDNYFRLVDMSRAECDGHTGGRRLLVWPESAVWPMSYHGTPQVQRDVEDLVDDGCQVLLGSVYREGQAIYNGSLVVGPEGPSEPYAKRRLVPWGEYVPLADLFPFVGKLARNAGEFTPGTEPALLPWGDERLAMAICYEVVFPAAVAEQVRAGATALVTITNDAWYGDTAAPWQHFRAARFRAAETRRVMMRAALTGVSGLIDAQGKVRAQLDVGERGVLRGRLQGHQHLTPYVRFPALVPGLAFLLATFAIVLGLRTP